MAGKLKRGMTLVELLVVIVILVTLVAVAIPLMAPSSSDRQVREAARGLNSFLHAAQARAIANGRPFGVAFKRLSQDTGNKTPGDPLNNNGVSVEAFIVEQPPPFSGFDERSTARVCVDHDLEAQRGQVLIQFSDSVPPSMLRPGDVIEIFGARYALIESDGIDDNGFYLPNTGDPDGTFAALPTGATGLLNFNERDPAFGVRFWTPAVRYKIHRQPTPTSDEPYQLPEGTVVDLRASGVGDDLPFYLPNVHDNDGAVAIMFSTSGAVSRVMFSRLPDCGTCGSQPIVNNIYLLVGASVPAPPTVANDQTLTRVGWNAAAEDADKERLRETINWLRGDSQWIAIGASSGRIATNENALVDPLAIIDDPSPTILATESTEQMRTRQIIAARKLATGMEQLGGR